MQNTRDGKGTLPRRTTAEAVADQLRLEIHSGQLLPGARLMQGEVSERLGVSTTPVREAFALLQADGLVRLDPHRGAVVYMPTLEELLELMEIREVLENHALVKAAQNITPKSIKSMQTTLNQMRKADANVRADHHRGFHHLVFQHAGNPRLSTMIAGLRDACTMHWPGREPEAEDVEHQQMIEALTKGDTKAMVALNRAHLRTTRDAGVAYLKSRDYGASPDQH
jgi:DNA-binding GntR family transcriptional regulator